MKYLADPTASEKIRQIIESVCKEWGISEEELRIKPGKSKHCKSPCHISSAKGVIAYMVKHKNNVRVQRIVLAPLLGVDGSMISKYVERMGRNLKSNKELRARIMSIAESLPFNINTEDLEALSIQRPPSTYANRGYQYLLDTYGQM